MRKVVLETILRAELLWDSEMTDVKYWAFCLFYLFFFNAAILGFCAPLGCCSFLILMWTSLSVKFIFVRVRRLQTPNQWSCWHHSIIMSSLAYWMMFNFHIHVNFSVFLLLFQMWSHCVKDTLISIFFKFIEIYIMVYHWHYSACIWEECISCWCQVECSIVLLGLIGL